MNRREFSARMGAIGTAAALATLGLPLWAPRSARAQGGPVEGVNYVKLSQPLPVAPGKIQVLEFFSYGCPHCSAFEPTLEGWLKTLPKDVAFARVPVPFLANAENFQRTYYALDALGQVDAMQAKVFYAVHQEHMRFDKPADIAAFMQKNGIDQAKFLDAFSSFSVATKVRQGTNMVAQHSLDSVPSIGVQGRYVTSPSMAGGMSQALAATDFLIERSRRG